MKREKHPLAGRTVPVRVRTGSPETPLFEGDFRVEDWWQNVDQYERSWGSCVGNPACLQYAMRAGVTGLPLDDEAVYGKVGGLEFILHDSELVAPSDVK